MGFRAGLWLAPLAVAKGKPVLPGTRRLACPRAATPEAGGTSPAPTDNPEAFSLALHAAATGDRLRFGSTIPPRVPRMGVFD